MDFTSYHERNPGDGWVERTTRVVRDLTIVVESMMIALDLVVNPCRNEEQMVNEEIEIRQLDQVMEIPSEGKSTYVLLDDSRVKMMLMGFAAGSGLAEHVAPKDLMIQVIRGELEFTVDQESVPGKTGTWIRMPAFTPHSVQATTGAVLLLTLLK